MKRQISFIADHGADSASLHTLYSQISPLPRALVDINTSLPHKGNKSTSTRYLEKRYKDVPVVTPHLPACWIPDAVILEGMFIIHTPPLPIMTWTDYIQLLLSNSAIPHFKAGVLQVHIIFDNPGSLSITPKEIERRRRDNSKKEPSSHDCSEISGISNEQPIPTTAWSDLLACRSCKKALTHFVAKEMLKVIPFSLHGNQKFTTNVGQTAYSVSSDGANQT